MLLQTVAGVCCKHKQLQPRIKFHSPFTAFTVTLYYQGYQTELIIKEKWQWNVRTPWLECFGWVNDPCLGRQTINQEVILLLEWTMKWALLLVWNAINCMTLPKFIKWCPSIDGFIIILNAFNSCDHHSFKHSRE